jgi:imidazole glycerol-phosphate synthase subunit HisF
MLKVRVIPCLLMLNGGLVKTVRFKEPKYVGDPINAVRIFNDKEVDEMVFLDIGATPAGTGPRFDLLADIASEAFMPFGYGGGITTVEQVKSLYGLGVEKVIFNSVAAVNPKLVEQAASLAGSSSVVASIDIRRNWLGKASVHVRCGKQDLRRDPVTYAREMERAGAGEILLNSIDRDGMMQGYDLELIQEVAGAVNVPVVAAGGAGHLGHFREAVERGASGVAAGSMFVFHGKHRAVLITYPKYQELEQLFKQEPTNAR